MLLEAKARVGTEYAKTDKGYCQVGHELVGFILNKVSFRSQQIVCQFVGESRHQTGRIVQKFRRIRDNYIAARFDAKCAVRCLIAADVNKF